MKQTVTKELILANLENVQELEQMYRSDKQTFKGIMNNLYAENGDNLTIKIWKERLNYSEEINWGEKKNIIAVLLGATICGFLIKLPVIFNILEDFYYPRNAGFIVIPVLAAFFLWKNKAQKQTIILVSSLLLISVFYMNLVPDENEQDLFTLTCIHNILFLWSILGIAFVGGIKNDAEKRMNFLKYNGDLIVMSALLGIAGGILSGITIGLFSIIGLNIETFYINNIGIVGISTLPLIASYLTQNNPQLVGKVSTVIAKIFGPIVLIMLSVYLSAIIYTGKDPYNDREFLLLFNMLLIGVMAIIFFSISGSGNSKSKWEVITLLTLSALTIIVCGIALSAIIFRISEWGFTPNRIAVLGSNVLILLHLFIVSTRLLWLTSNRGSEFEVGKSVTDFLPIYFVWTVFVCYLLPFIF